MLYVWDFVFVVAYLALEKAAFRWQRKKLRWFFAVRAALTWMQFISIIIYLYGRPVHNSTERLVSFSMMLLTKLVADCISNDYCKKTINKRNEINIR